MTQLFDTATYEDRSEPSEPIDTHAETGGLRHLRSMPTGDALAGRTTQWRLDENTIEIGRRGIQAARRALRDAAKATGGATRAA